MHIQMLNRARICNDLILKSGLRVEIELLMVKIQLERELELPSNNSPESISIFNKTGPDLSEVWCLNSATNFAGSQYFQS